MDQVRAALGRRDFASARAILGEWPEAPPLLAAQVAQLSGDAEGEQAGAVPACNRQAFIVQPNFSGVLCHESIRGDRQA